MLTINIAFYIADFIGLESFGSAHPYQLRHGGASRDYQHKISQDALPDRDPEERKMEVCCIGPKVRKRRKTQPTSVAPKVLMKLQSASKRIEKNGPWPALKPGRSLTEQVFLEIFSGSGRLSKKVAQITGWTVLLWDICLGADYDLLNPAHRQKLKDWIRGGKVIAFHLGTPCESFSRAQDVPPGPAPLGTPPGNSSTKHLFDINWRLYIYIYISWI